MIQAIYINEQHDVQIFEVGKKTSKPYGDDIVKEIKVKDLHRKHIIIFLQNGMQVTFFGHPFSCLSNKDAISNQ